MNFFETSFNETKFCLTFRLVCSNLHQKQVYTQSLVYSALNTQTDTHAKTTDSFLISKGSKFGMLVVLWFPMAFDGSTPTTWDFKAPVSI